MATTTTLAEQPSSPPAGGTAVTSPQSVNLRATVGAYYFDGWAGKSARWQPSSIRPRTSQRE
jgi:hypothetical protein